MFRGVDYSWSRPGGANIKEAGFDFAMRYVPYPGTGLKGLDETEIVDLQANDVGIGLVFESTANRVLDGYNAGVVDAQTTTRAILSLDWPQDLAVFFAVDFDAQASQYLTILDYFNGAKSVMGLARMGGYGHDKVLEYLRTSRAITYTWQTTAWSGGRVLEGRNLFQEYPGGQINGADVDYNQCYDEGAGYLWRKDMVSQEEYDTKVEAARQRLSLITFLADLDKYPEFQDVWAYAVSKGYVK